MKVFLPTSLSTPKLRKSLSECGARSTVALFLGSHARFPEADYVSYYFPDVNSAIGKCKWKKLAGFFSHPTFFSEEFDQHRRPVQPAEAHFKCCIFGIHEGAVARMNCEYHWSLFLPTRTLIRSIPTSTLLLSQQFNMSQQRYVASPSYFSSKGTNGMMIGYKCLDCVCLVFYRVSFTTAVLGFCTIHTLSTN